MSTSAGITDSPHSPDETIGDNGTPVADTSPSANDPNAVSSVLQDALGITPSGTCLRHPNCPVMNLDQQRIMSCRICFSEEKSVGITQRKSFSAVVHQLQRMKPESQTSLSADSTEGAAADTTEATTAETVKAAVANTTDASSSLALQQPQALESIMKRLSQVQNWMLRQKEKEVMSLQLTIHRLEQRLKDSEATVDEQKQTIKALRKTIQQDLKIIKTMATQKEKELEASGHSRTSSCLNSQATGQDAKKAPRAPAAVAKKTLLGQDDEEEQDDEVSESELYSPIRMDKDKNRSAMTTSPDLGLPNNPILGRLYSSPPKTGQAQRPGLGAAAVAMSGGALGNESSQLERRRGRKNLLERTPSTLSLDASVTIPEEAGDNDEVDEKLLAKLQAEIILNDQDDADDNDDNDDDSSDDSQENSIFAPPQRSEYWTDADMSMASDPSKIFASFRGGLLDIPKSPPPNRHDKRAPKKKLQIQIDNRERGVLRIPSMRSVVRSNSGMSDATGASLHNGIPVGLMSSVLQATPFDTQSDFSQSPASATANYNPFVIHSGGGQHSKSSLSRPPSVLNVPTFGGLDDDSPHRPNISGGGADFMRADSEVTEPYSIESLEAYQQESERSLCDTKASATAVTASKLLGQPKVDDKALLSVTRASCQDKYGDPGMFTGTLLASEGLPHGRGSMNYESGRIYDGEWLKGHWNGNGKLLNPNGDSYEGEFVFDARHGQGRYKWDNGDIYVGHFSQDKRHGKGKFSFHNGNVYEGEFVDGMFEGYGKYSFADGFYEGDWKQGRYDGNGELRYASGGKYTGEFRNSVAHGFGMEISPGGKTRRGVWQEGKPVNF